MLLRNPIFSLVLQISEESSLFHGKKTIFGNDHMVKDADPEYPPGFGQLPRDFNVLGARLEGSGRMVVDTDNGSRPVGYRICKDLAGMDEAVIKEADGNDPVAEDLACTVKSDADKMFLFLKFETIQQDDDILRTCYPYDLPGVLFRITP